MSTTSAPDTAVEPVVVDEHERWRGVALEAGPVDATGNQFLRRRSRQLLWDLLRPYKGWLAVMVLVVLVETLVADPGPTAPVTVDARAAVEATARAAKTASRVLATATRATKDAALHAMADALVASSARIVTGTGA